MDFVGHPKKLNHIKKVDHTKNYFIDSFQIINKEQKFPIDQYYSLGQSSH